MTFMDDYLATWNYWNYKQCSFVALKKQKHFALTGIK